MKERDALVFRKSSYSGGNGSCIELASSGEQVFAVRDSKDPSGPTLRFTAHDLRTLVDAVKNDRI